MLECATGVVKATHAAGREARATLVSVVESGALAVPIGMCVSDLCGKYSRITHSKTVGSLAIRLQAIAHGAVRAWPAAGKVRKMTRTNATGLRPSAVMIDTCACNLALRSQPAFYQLALPQFTM